MNPPILQSSKPPILQSSHPPIRQSSNPPIYQSTNPPIRQSSNPPILQFSNPQILENPKNWMSAAEASACKPGLAGERKAHFFVLRGQLSFDRVVLRKGLCCSLAIRTGFIRTAQVPRFLQRRSKFTPRPSLRAPCCLRSLRSPA